MDDMILMLSLKYQLGEAKKQLGSDCTYLAFEQKKDDYFISFAVKNEQGGKDKGSYKVGKDLTKITKGFFDGLVYNIKNKKYLNVS
jgi:hypothetical protein